jgi:hypothetical protein
MTGTDGLKLQPEADDSGKDDDTTTATTMLMRYMILYKGTLNTPAPAGKNRQRKPETGAQL